VPDVRWWAPLFAVLGVVALAQGILMRTGRWRGWWRDQRNPHSPLVQRNIVFASLPWGAAIALGFLGVILVDRPSPWREVALGAFYLMIALMLLGFVFLVYQPGWIKPAWLREMERAAPRSPSGADPLAAGEPPEMPRWEYYATAVVTVGVVVLWYAFDWPSSALVGAGLGVSYLVTSRIRRSR
jgi:hypothetical protein